MSRGIGLLLTSRLSDGEALLLTDTATITMVGMRFPIDVAFVDERWRVVDLVHRLRPWVLVRHASGARATLELPAGVIARSGTQVGDELSTEALA